jgi:hypothetical protein
MIFRSPILMMFTAALTLIAFIAEAAAGLHFDISGRNMFLLVFSESVVACGVVGYFDPIYQNGYSTLGYLFAGIVGIMPIMFAYVAGDDLLTKVMILSAVCYFGAVAIGHQVKAKKNAEKLARHFRMQLRD